jgi:hypothetical protein
VQPVHVLLAITVLTRSTDLPVQPTLIHSVSVHPLLAVLTLRVPYQLIFYLQFVHVSLGTWQMPQLTNVLTLMNVLMLLLTTVLESLIGASILTELTHVVLPMIHMVFVEVQQIHAQPEHPPVHQVLTNWQPYAHATPDTHNLPLLHVQTLTNAWPIMVTVRQPATASTPMVDLTAQLQLILMVYVPQPHLVLLHARWTVPAPQTMQLDDRHMSALA